MKISVIIPLFNKADYVFGCISSVLSQTYKDLEIIVVNDGSTDDGYNVVKAVKDRRIILVSQVNSGAAEARNHGIRLASGELIAFLDADDSWLPSNLQAHFDILFHNPDLFWSVGSYIRKQIKGKYSEMDPPTGIGNKITGGASYNALELVRSGHVWTGAVVMRREVFEAVGFMDCSLKTAEDLDLWVRLSLCFPYLGYVDKPIAEYLIDVPNSLSKFQISDPDNLPHLKFVRKHIALAQELPKANRKIVLGICKGVLDVGLKKLLLSGHSEYVVKNLNHFTSLIDNFFIVKCIVLSKVPTFILRISFNLLQKYKYYHGR